jgi:uncharacterized membrane protein YecN with MAPEG domain
MVWSYLPDLSSPTLHTHEPAYGLCLLVALVMTVQCTLQGFLVPLQRFKVYTKDYFAKHFAEFKGWTPHEGYPDMGCGYYSKHLSHENWLLINNAQRAHYNHLESLLFNVLALLVAGAFHPVLSARLGIGVVVGRVLYALGYTQFGARARSPGAIVLDVCGIALTGIALISAFNFAGGKAALWECISFGGVAPGNKPDEL